MSQHLLSDVKVTCGVPHVLPAINDEDRFANEGLPRKIYKMRMRPCCFLKLKIADKINDVRFTARFNRVAEGAMQVM